MKCVDVGVRGPMVELLAGNEDRKITFFDRNSTCKCTFQTIKISKISGKMCTT